jgi:hypothetical protein
MNRKEFLQKTQSLCLCCGALLTLGKTTEAAAQTSDQQFVQNWLIDLLETIETQTDEKTRKKLMRGCGIGCYQRHQFKQDIAAQGAGSLDKLIQAYKKNFEIWKEDNRVHIRYGAVSTSCYCPVARLHPAKPNDMHCYCTLSTHQTIFETALGRPIKADIVETLRRGGKTCHFIMDVS